MEHLHEVLLRVEPSLLDNEMVDVSLNPVVLQVVSVDEVQGNNDGDRL